ncbi:MAG: threonine/serine exporter family protein, partial [Lachnospiraceae bacterium]
ISRYICSNTPAYNNIEAEVDSIRKAREFPWQVTIAGYMLASGAFAIFFGGSIRDGLVAALLSALAYVIDMKIKPLGFNMLMYNFFCTFLLGALARLIGVTGFIDNLDKVLIGLVMLYIPGTQMTNSLRDILCGDIMSGLLRLIEAVILAISIALGFATSIVALNMTF